MKLLLDECVTRYLKADFIGHEVKTVREAGFTGLKNGQIAQGCGDGVRCSCYSRSEHSAPTEPSNVPR